LLNGGVGEEQPASVTDVKGEFEKFACEILLDSAHVTWKREVPGGVLVVDEVRIEMNGEASTPRPPVGAGMAGR
jgi:hypothetical protein